MDEDKSWSPWVKFKQDLEIITEITEPPCKNCEWFQPRRKYGPRGAMDGVEICTAESMYHDFSCYRRKPE